jgi:hypothetical protein
MKKTQEELLLDSLANQPATITGYQYSPEDGRYIGAYTFPNNFDKLEVHLPPCTVLEKPPEAVGKVAFFIGNGWRLRDEENYFDSHDLSGVEYEDLLPEHLNELKRAGLYGQFVRKLHSIGKIDTTDETALAVKTQKGIDKRRLDADLIEAHAENNRRLKGGEL